MCKYVVIVGAVCSSNGKGIAANSIGLLLKCRGHDVTYIKYDPYLNLSSSILAPKEHGETFVLDDGKECDLDLGHAERIMGINVTKKNICTAGHLHSKLIQDQEEGKYAGLTCQAVPQLTNLVEERLLEVGKDKDIVIAEIGGTVGDNESFLFFEAVRRFQQKHKNDVLIVMVAPILWMNTVKEFKTKPLQNGVAELRKYGLQPDILLCRVDRAVPNKILDKISDLTGIKREHIIDAPDVKTIYQVPIEFYNRHVDDLIVDLLRLNRSSCRIHKYKDVVEKYVDNNYESVNIGVIAKYDNFDEAYISVKEALTHSGVACSANINIKWIKSEELEKTKDYKLFEGLHGLIVPGGFDKRGVEGKLRACTYARENKIPFLGICLGLQCMAIEFARNVCGMKDANSYEFDKTTKHPVVHFVEGQEGLVKKHETLRLGAYDCELTKDSISAELYGTKSISERHRHRYEVNFAFIKDFSSNGFYVTGTNPGTGLVEVMELDRKLHPYYLGTQAHPEFKSRLMSPAPLFRGLVAEAVKYREALNTQSDK